jgi:two-component system, NarL family, response regulator LiaR
MIRVLVVDDQVVVAEGLRVVLNASPTISVIGLAFDGQQALEQVERLQPDLVLMDLQMPVMNGVQATRTLGMRFPALPVLVLTTYDNDEWVLDAVRAGARGYLLKDISRDELVAAIEGVVAGQAPLDPAVAPRLLAFVRDGPAPTRELLAQLTPREQDVLRLLAHGLTNAAIADRLHLAEGTVRNHVSAILGKLQVDDRAQATALAWRCGLPK